MLSRRCNTLSDCRARAGRITDSLIRMFSDDSRAVRFLLLHAAAIDHEMAERVLGFYGTAAMLQSAYLQHGVDAWLLLRRSRCRSRGPRRQRHAARRRHVPTPPTPAPLLRTLTRTMRRSPTTGLQAKPRTTARERVNRTPIAIQLRSSGAVPQHGAESASWRLVSGPDPPGARGPRGHTACEGTRSYRTRCWCCTCLAGSWRHLACSGVSTGATAPSRRCGVNWIEAVHPGW